MQSLPVFPFGLCRVLCALAVISVSLLSPAAAQDCPEVGLSQACCRLAAPLDGRSVAEGGYGWHPAPGGAAGLCQGLASRNRSGGLIGLTDLRESPAFSELPERVTVAYRPLPISPASPVAFTGNPMRPGTAFYIAGSFEGGNNLIWITDPFSRRGQKLEEFGFEAVFRHAGRDVQTPLILLGDGAALEGRSEARAIFGSTLPIGAAIVTAEPLAPDTLAPTGAAPRVLDLHRPSARQIEVRLPVDLPEAFQLSVITCDVGDAACEPTVDGDLRRVFRVIWPDA